MKKMSFLPLTIFFLSVIFSISSCQNQSISDLQIQYEQNSSSLIALNYASKSNFIKSSKQKKTLAYAFDEQVLDFLNKNSSSNENSTNYPLSLQIQLETLQNPKIDFFLLNENEIKKNTKYLSSKKAVSGKTSTCTLSIMLPYKNDVSGFALSCTQGEAKIHSVQFVNSKIGWSFTQNIPWFAFGTNGGKIPETKQEAQNSALNFELENSNSVSNLFSESKIYFALSNVKTNYDDPKGYRVQFKNEKQILNFYPKKEKHNEIIPILAFENFPKTMQCIQGSEFVDAVIFLPQGSVSPQASVSSQSSISPQVSDNSKNTIAPINTDCGLIQNWPKKNWRQEDFELFEWSDFPGVLIFDFASYKIQDDFLKRLAFFTEKTGYIGKLATYEQIKNEHGYNAHDYKAESLASFFETAREQNFSLNESENLLKEILLDCGVITLDKSGRFRAGKGALISISQESPNYLRTLFLCHEGMHGVFFTNADFRRFIYELYDKTDSQSVGFLKAYFSVTPSLRYNINDEYLLKNEFMAYLVQQPLASTEKYFSENLANRYYINRENPDLAQYIKDTKANCLVDAAKDLDKHIFEKWGFNLGRTWLISIYYE